MFSFLKKNNTNPTFVIDFPQIAISPDTHSFIDLLKASTIEAENINIRKGNMHYHGTELATVGIIVEGISDLMTTVAATLAEPVNQGYLDFGFTHRTLLKCDSCNMDFFRVQ